MTPALDAKLKLLEKEGRLKGKERVIVDIVPPRDGFGRKIVISDKRTLLNFTSNSYLGISNDARLIKAEHEADLKFGVGPGAVRFISGTQQPHIKLEEKLAQFYKKESAMIFSSAYAANCGIIAPLMDKDTCIISDELNHNSIIMAIRFAGVSRDRKGIYAHSNMDELKKCIDKFVGKTKRLIIVSDGVFSMRGDYAPLKDIVNLAKEYDAKFEEGIITVVDDSHGIGAYGKTGRGTPETLLIWGGCGLQALYMVPYFANKGVKNFILVYRGKPAMMYMKRCVTDLDAHLYFVNSEDQSELKLLKKELGQEDGFVSIELTGQEKLQKMVIAYASPKGKIFYYGLPQGGRKVIIPGTNIDIHTFLTGKAGIEELNLNGVKAIRVMGRDNESWRETIEALKINAQLRKEIMKPLVMAGTTENIGELVEYLINNGVRYNQEPYGPRPTKFAFINEKMIKK